jgi:hypothetical protein
MLSKNPRFDWLLPSLVSAAFVGSFMHDLQPTSVHHENVGE